MVESEEKNKRKRMICTKCHTNKVVTDFIKNRPWCKSCKSASDKACRIRNADKLQNYFKAHYEQNKEKLSQKFKDRYESKRDQILIKQKERYAKVAQTEEYRALRAARQAKRRAAQLQATPAWSDLEAIKNFYRNRPEGFEVDHVIPLQGEVVCGLRVLQNLQYLPKSENCSKGNRVKAA